MNRAFVKESEPAEPRCPKTAGCEGIGVPVTRRTLLAHVPESSAKTLAGSSCHYCPNPGCPVAYFDAWGASVPSTELRRPAYPKSLTAPVCSCFGITAQEVREEAEAHRKDRVREWIAKAESAEARCETESPSGTSCVSEIRRIFVKHFKPE